MKPATPPDETALLSAISSMKGPVLVLSTRVGKGNVSIGEALCERLEQAGVPCAGHRQIEDILPAGSVREDLVRYRFISNRLRWLLRLIYRIPIFYYRKYVRELLRAGGRLDSLEELLRQSQCRTVLCVSHRPGFWVSLHKRRTQASFDCWGVLTEFGPTLGWRYVFWPSLNGFLSPLERRHFHYAFPPGLRFVHAPLPVKQAYMRLSDETADRNRVLLVAGYWGQHSTSRMSHIARQLLAADTNLRVEIVCGTNERMRDQLSRRYHGESRVRVWGALDDLVDLLRGCASVVTKPGMSTLLEAHACGRKIFLIKGMPVAEEANARHALSCFGAELFSITAFLHWRDERPAVSP